MDDPADSRHARSHSLIRGELGASLHRVPRPFTDYAGSKVRNTADEVEGPLLIRRRVDVYATASVTIGETAEGEVRLR